MARDKETRLKELMALIARKEAFIKQLEEVLGRTRQKAQNLMNQLAKEGEEITRV